MPDTIGNITVPEIAASGVFPIVSDYPYGCANHSDVAIHQFGSANAKIEQRYLLGTGAKTFTVRKAWLRESDRVALRNFWETNKGGYGAFTYNALDDDGNGTTAYTCRFANEPLSWEMVADWACSLGVTLIEIPTGEAPTYTLNSTVTRFPSAALQTALLSQVQQVIPLIKIQPLQAGYPAIYLSDRRCTVGGQLYQARLIDFDGISQSMGGDADDASFTFGNADRVMRDLANDVDLYRASLEFSLFHVGQGIKVDLWKGDVVNWSLDAGPEFKLSASDGLYELNLPYPTRKITRTCWKPLNGQGCPFATAGALDLVHFPSADAGSCDKGYDTPNGCLAHGMKKYYGGITAEPQSVRIKDNSTGVWGFGRSPLTSVSLVADSIYDQVLPEVYTDRDMPVNCKIAAGRDESDFYTALGIVGEGPIVAFTAPHMVDKDGDGKKETFVGQTLDGQFNHGCKFDANGNFIGTSLGLRTVLGADPAGDHDYFSLDQSGDQTGGDWRKVYYGNSTYKDNFAAGTAFLTIRRTDPKGLQLSRPGDHSMVATVTQGLGGWTWSGPGARTWGSTLTNPVWIAVNMLMRARGLRLGAGASSAQLDLAEALFDVNAAVTAASVCDQQVAALVGSSTETQFAFRGVLQEEKPLRDWLQEVLMNCLGYYTFAFGKVKFGVRCNSSSAEAFTEGNILFRSLQLSPLKPAFNRLTANFADQEFDFVANSVAMYDSDHAALVGGGAGPLFLKSTVNLSGTSTKSQAARIITERLREELGGINPSEWKNARQVVFKTTVLALSTEPGVVCSMTHQDMPGGSGEFRVISWKLNKDFSIDIQGRTTTDSMYTLTIGPKPADVTASPVPVEILPPVPDDVQSFEVTQSRSGDTLIFDVTYHPPNPIGSFSGVYGVFEMPDGSGAFSYAPDQTYNGDPDGDADARKGTARFMMAAPSSAAAWRFALGSCTPTFREDFIPHGQDGETPNQVLSVPAAGSEANPPAQPTSVSCSEHVAERYRDDSTLTHTLLYPVVNLPADSGALWVLVYLSLDNGATYKFSGSPNGLLGKKFLSDTTGYDVLVPVRSTDTTARIKVCTGNQAGENDFSVAVESAPFIIKGIQAVSNAAVTAATLGTVSPKKDESSGWRWAELSGVSWTEQATVDPNAFMTKFYVRETSIDGIPAPDEKGQWREWFEKTTMSGSRSSDTSEVLQITYRAAGDPYHYLQVQCVVVTRLSKNPADWSVTGTVQKCWPGGASFAQVDFGNLGTPPAATSITEMTAGAGGASDFPYNAVTPDGAQYWSIPSISFDNTGAASDPNAFRVFVTAQDLDANHNSVGPEQPFDSEGIAPDGEILTMGPIMGAYGTAGYSYTRTGNIAYVRFRLYVLNALDPASTSAFLNPACAVLQSGVGNGAGYIDVMVARNGAVPPGALSASRLDPRTIGAGLTLTASGLKFATANMSNLLMNPGFEDDFAQWANSGCSIQTTGAYTGSKCVKMPANGNVQQTGITARPGEAYYLEGYLKFDAGSTGNVRLAFVFQDANGSGIGNLIVLCPSNTADWTKFSGSATAPANTSKLYVHILFDDASPSGTAYLDNVLLGRVIGASQVQMGAGLKPDGSGAVALAFGAGLKADEAGYAAINPGTSIDVQNGQVVVKQGQITSGFFAAGALGDDLTKYSASKKPVGVYYGLPSAADTTVPDVVFNTADGKLYRRIGYSWSAAVAPGDIIAGTVASGVTITGTCYANKLVENGGGITGCRLTLNLNGVTATIANQWDALYGAYAGVVVQQNGQFSRAIVSYGGMAIVNSSGYKGAELKPSLLALWNTANALTITLDGTTGQFWSAYNAYNLPPLHLGGYYLWIDSFGRLRIKAGIPGFDTDGTVVGAQS